MSSANENGPEPHSNATVLPLINRNILVDITPGSNQMNPPKDDSLKTAMPTNIRKQRLQQPKISLENLRAASGLHLETGDHHTPESKGHLHLESEKGSQVSSPSIEKTVQDYINESETQFKSQMLELQIQRDNYQQESQTLRESIHNLELRNQKIRTNTERLKEELYELDSKVDELEMILANMRSQNTKKFRLREREVNLDIQELSNKLDEELHTLEKELKHEYEDVILKYNDKIALKEVHDLQIELEHKLDQVENLVEKSQIEIRDFEHEKSQEYERRLTEVETPLNELNQEIESRKQTLSQWELEISSIELKMSELEKHNDQMKHSIKEDEELIQFATGQLEQQQLEYNMLQEDVQTKTEILQLKTNEMNDMKRKHSTKVSQLEIEKLKKRRIIHQIQDLKHKMVVSISSNDEKLILDDNENELDKQQMILNGELISFDKIYGPHTDSNVYFEDCQCHIEDSLLGIPVSMINIHINDTAQSFSLTSDQISFHMSRLKTKLKSNPQLYSSYSIQYELCDMENMYDDATSTTIMSNLQEVKQKLVFLSAWLLRCRLDVTLAKKNHSGDSHISTTINFVQLKGTNEVMQTLLSLNGSAGSDKPLSNLYNYTRSRTTFHFEDFSSIKLVKWLKMASRLNQTDSPNIKKILQSLR